MGPVESEPVAVYVPESFTSDEADVLRRYFTNLDGPVFALVNLPEVVKGALFARYSRSPKSLRRLFLDEFVGDLDIRGDQSIDATIGLDRAEELYERVFFDYGDDSVAQLGGVHLACEQASNLLTKMLEWGRLMSYLEQSTRYIAYDSRLGGRYRYLPRSRRCSPARSAPATSATSTGSSTPTASAPSSSPTTSVTRSNAVPTTASSSTARRRGRRRSTRSAACFPAAATSNVGIYGTGQAFEALLLRMRAHPLPEARDYADLMLHELRKVIPSFLRRVDIAERGGEWSEYLADTRDRLGERSSPTCSAAPRSSRAPRSTLVDFDPDAEDNILAAICYSAFVAARVADPRAGARIRRRRTGVAVQGVRRRAGEPPAQAGAGVRAQLLPLRRAERLRRIP